MTQPEATAAVPSQTNEDAQAEFIKKKTPPKNPKYLSLLALMRKQHCVKQTVHFIFFI